MIEIAQNFYTQICSVSSRTEKEHLVNDFKSYYHSLTAEQKLVIQPFFAQLKLSIQEDFQKLDALTEKFEKKYSMKFTELENFAETI